MTIQSQQPNIRPYMSNRWIIRNRWITAMLHLGSSVEKSGRSIRHVKRLDY